MSHTKAPGLIPISTARVAWSCVFRVASSECLSHKELNAWLARILLKWSDREPPISFRMPFMSAESLATTVGGLISLVVFFVVIAFLGLSHNTVDLVSKWFAWKPPRVNQTLARHLDTLIRCAPGQV